MRLAVRVAGELLITFAVVALLFVGYELWFTDWLNARDQDRLRGELTSQWADGNDPLRGLTVADVPHPAIGSGVGIIRIPRLGRDYAKVIVEGTTRDALNKGPGHYVNSAWPGQVGNFAVAGHHDGRGAPFDNLEDLRTGDAIVIETSDTYFVYRVLGDRATGDASVPGEDGIVGKRVVDASAVSVVAPVPEHPGQVPHRRLLTLTTCKEAYFSLQRTIIHAELDGAPLPKSAGLPQGVFT